MDYRHSCVIDANAIYKTLVLVLLTQAGQGQKQEWKVQNYTLAEGERLIDTAPPTVRPYAGAAGYIKPKWDAGTAAWIEAATEEEIAAWEAEHPDPNAKTLTRAQDARQEENKAALAAWLAEHPLTWVDGNVYGVTEADQNEMALNLQQYQIQVAAGREIPLEWHTQKKQCHTFTEEQYGALLLAIIDYVYPYRRYQEAVKEAIYAAATMEEVAAVGIDYASVAHE